VVESPVRRASIRGLNAARWRQRASRIRREAMALSQEIFSNETISHLVRASTEFILAVDSMIPRDQIPREVREHYTNAKKETILLFKSLLDAQLKTVEEDSERQGFKKIDLE
jgi:hypothetical protein